ncbi:MAG: DNA translocase FtsK 4TM domain-containing protein [Candidatus Eisenbacteria bacterium]
MASSISAKRQRQILAVLLGAFSVLSAASVATYHAPVPGEAPWSPPNACGPAGGLLAYGLVWSFGQVAAFGVPLLAALWGWNRLRDQKPLPLLLTSALGALLVFEICTLFGLGGLDRERWAGGWGFAATLALQSSLGLVGSWIVATALLFVTALAASEMGFHWIGKLAHGLVLNPARGVAGGVVGAWGQWQERRAEAERLAAKQKAKDAKAPKKPVKTAAAPLAASAVADEAEAAPRAQAKGKAAPVESAVALADEGDDDGDAPVAMAPPPPPVIKKNAPSRPKSLEPERPTGPAPEEPLPPLGLLELPQQPEDLVTAADLTHQATLLTTKLADFGIEGRVTEIHPGPVVTMFEFEPAAGVKVNSIVALEDDLALALRAIRIRVIAPLPGKGTVGVEIPNPRRRTVYLREVLSSQAYESSNAALKVPLGVDVSGTSFVSDLTKMPHVLIAGSTGAGKSVCLNTIITGLLFQHDPSSLQLVMIDPKMVELSMYNGIPHLTLPVVTDSKKASRALRWAVGEMEKRYKLLASVGARNINTYNERIAEGKVPPSDGSDKVPERLGYVVVIVDELADLMLTAPAEIEEPIARLAQMARAVGIHLVLATQRPSVDVITGVIKANFPSRIAFRVASKTDSRTVLDMNGAENLLGMGDMLFLPMGKADAHRVHGCFVSEEETQRVVDFWRAKAAASTAPPPPLATEVNIPEGDEEELAEDGFMADELVPQAACLVVMHNQGSTSLLQRRLQVGYSRAGRLMDQLEQLGVVGPFNGSKARDVLVDQNWLMQKGFM